MLNITETTLQKYKFVLRQRITEECLNDMDIDITVDRMTKEVIFRFRKDILGRKMDKIEFPLNWKEAVKEAFYNWLKRHKIKLLNKYIKNHPVKHNVYEVREYYPKISIPEHEHRVRFERIEEDLNGWEVE